MREKPTSGPSPGPDHKKHWGSKEPDERPSEKRLRDWQLTPPRMNTLMLSDRGQNVLGQIFPKGKAPAYRPGTLQADIDTPNRTYRGKVYLLDFSKLPDGRKKQLVEYIAGLDGYSEEHIRERAEEQGKVPIREDLVHSVYEPSSERTDFDYQRWP